MQNQQSLFGHPVIGCKSVLMRSRSNMLKVGQDKGGLLPQISLSKSSSASHTALPCKTQWSWDQILEKLKVLEFYPPPPKLVFFSQRVVQIEASKRSEEKWWHTHHAPMTLVFKNTIHRPLGPMGERGFLHGPDAWRLCGRPCLPTENSSCLRPPLRAQLCYVAALGWPE